MKDYAHAVTCTYMFLEALFIIAETWKQPKMFFNRWMNKQMWYIHTMEYYSATKKNELLIHATMWMYLMLSEKRQKMSK